MPISGILRRGVVSDVEKDATSFQRKNAYQFISLVILEFGVSKSILKRRGILFHIHFYPQDITCSISYASTPFSKSSCTREKKPNRHAT